MMRARAFAALLVPLSIAGCKEEVAPATCPERTTLVDSICRPTCITDDDCLFSEACLTGVCLPRNASEGPRVRLFEPDRIAVTRSDPTVRFDYVVTNANTVELSPIPGGLSEHAGTIEVTLSESTDFTLVGRTPDKGEDSVTRRVELVEDPLPGTLSVSIQVERSDVEPCTAVDVQWTIVGELEGKTLEVHLDADGTEVFRSSDPFGRTTVQLDGPRDLQMFAQADDLTGQSDPIPAQPGVLCWATGSPQGEVGFGDTVLIEWETNRAAAVVVEEESTGNRLYTHPVFNRDERNVGRWLVVPRRDERYRLVAVLPDQGGTEEATIDVQVTGDPPAPLIDAFTVQPEWYFAPNDLSVAWETRGAANVSLAFDNMSQTLGSESGVISVLAERTAELWLTADRNGLTTTRRALAFATIDELEPNEARDMANPLQLPGPQGQNTLVARLGSFDLVGFDVDRYRIAANGALRVQVFDPMGTDCADLAGTTVELEQEGAVVGTAIISAGCPELFFDGRTGEHLVTLYPSNLTGMLALGYVLAIDPAPVMCGDGVLEMSETCDDGNDVPGDGCSRCTLEPGFTYEQSNGDVVFEPPPPEAHPLDFIPYRPGQTDPLDEGFAIIPANILYFGHRYAGIMVHVNGYVTLLPELDVEAGLASPRVPNALIAGFGTDLRVESSSAILHWQSFDPGFGNSLSIQWEGVHGFDGNGTSIGPISFRVQIGENGAVRFTYAESNQVSPEYVWVGGIEDATGHYAYPIKDCLDVCVGAPMSSEISFIPR